MTLLLTTQEYRVLSFKAVTTAEATKETIKETFLKIRMDKEWNAVIESFHFLKQTETYEELLMEQKLPFPLTNRDVALALVRTT